MEAVVTITIVLAVAIAFVGADRTVEVSGIYVNIQSQSGKITLSRRADPRMDENAVTFALEELRELDSNGNPVGLSSSNKHSFSDFDMEDFTISNLMEMRYGTVDAARLEAETTVNYARVRIIMFIFKSEGTITENGDHFQVRNGTVRFNIDMTNWGFCNPCLQGSSREYGYYLEIAASIKSRGDTIRPLSEGLLRNQPKIYDLGYGTRLIAPRQATVDSRTVTMAPGYPAVRRHIDRQMFVMRIPKFTYKMEYAPMIQLSASVLTTSSLLALIVCGMFALLL